MGTALIYAGATGFMATAAIFAATAAIAFSGRRKSKASPQLPELPDLSAAQTLVLDAMETEIAHTARKLAAFTGLPEATVGRARRDLYDAGMVDFGPLSADGGMTGKLAGRGYWLNEYGAEIQRRFRLANDNTATRCAA